MRVYIEPNFRGEDKGDGGIRRVVEAQNRWLPDYDIEVVKDIRQAEVVNVHISMSTHTARYLKQFTDVPLIVSNHGAYWAEHNWKEWTSPYGRNSGGDWCYVANAECMDSIRKSDIITAPSEWVAQTIRRNSLRRVRAIGHGIDFEDWPMGTSAGYVLWNKTRIDEICDPEPIVELARRAPDVPFLSTFGEKSLVNMKVTGRVPYEEAKQQLQKAGVYLCTSRETFGISTLEAMASGVPVLAWAWGGQLEIVDHKKTGWLAPPGDYDALLEGLYYCLRHREEMGKAARKVVEEKYQWKDVMESYALLYRELAVEAAEERPRISVIVPAYDLEKFLPEALESVESQTVEDWECIIVDDVSPDRCGEIADEYAKKDKRFSVIHNAENQYLAGVLNTGIGKARGRYIISLDADNILPNRSLELLATALDNDRGIHIAYGDVEFLDPDGKRWHSGWPPTFKAEWQLQRRVDDRPANLVPSGAMYRRSVWELTGGYRKRYQTAEDADFWTRATSYGFRAEKVVEADTLIYRNREGSMSREKKPADWSVWYPWARQLTLPPAAIDYEEQQPIPSYEPVLVSVIIPVGPGHEELLIDALDSVDSQTFRFWECVIVNDTGKPLPWVPSWARVIETKGEIGVAAARNLGIKLSKAKLFIPLDADDTLEPSALAKLYPVQKEWGGYVYSDWFERWVGRDLGKWDTQEYDAQLLLQKGCLHAVTALYSRVAWEQVGGFDETLPAWEDWDFQLKLAEAGICGTRIPEPLFTYRKDTGQRREENYAAFELSKQGILDKWKSHFQGRKELMACSRCPGGGGGRVQPSTLMSPLVRAPQTPDDVSEYVIVEYIGLKQGGRTFRAPSGQTYRFSATPSEKVKYVRRDDIPFFSEKVDFRIVQERAPAGV